MTSATEREALKERLVQSKADFREKYRMLLRWGLLSTRRTPDERAEETRAVAECEEALKRFEKAFSEYTKCEGLS